MADTVNKDKWKRLDALVEINQYKNLNELAHRNSLSKAETLRIFIEIGFAVLDNNIDLALNYATQLPNKDRS